MFTPIVSIIGRPNVGKSTIFNRIVQKRLAIVHPESGVTRDRKYYDSIWNGIRFTVVDTGGLVPNSKEKIEKLIEKQTKIAIEESEVIIFVVDGKKGLTELDKEVAKRLYPIKEKVILTVNKIDNKKAEDNIYEFLELGLSKPIGISSINGRNFGDFLDKITDKLPLKKEQAFLDNGAVKIAVVGKPNVGKSLLVNKIIGQEAVIVSESPGTTRDSINLHFTYKDNPMTIIDTAGLRKKSKVKYDIEYYSNIRSIRSIDLADVVVVLLDATKKISIQDKRITNYAKSKYKEIILTVNKWDLIKKDNFTTSKFIKTIREEMNFVQFSPIIFISALTNLHISKLLELILEIEKQSKIRIKTSELNKFLHYIVKKFPPKHSNKIPLKLYYCTQAATHPPTFIFSVNNKKLVTKNYERYICNQIRKKYRFEGSPIKLKFKGKT